MIKYIKPLLTKFTIFARDRMGFSRPPRLFLKQDSKNGMCALGKTAHYDPNNGAITIFISGRHPKDILRSYAHELVHHTQNCRGDLSPEKMKTMNAAYAQENEHMRKMEEEAYLQGNMCFRDWEDGLDNKLKYKIYIAEQIFLKENKKMSVKLNKEDLKKLISKLLERNNDSSGDRPEEEPADSESLDSAEDCGGCGSEDCPVCAAAGDDSDEIETQAEGQAEGGNEVKGNRMTPEDEEGIYENRFTPRNNKLFDKLVKKWVK
jgi:hypothetical protein